MNDITTLKINFLSISNIYSFLESNLLKLRTLNLIFYLKVFHKEKTTARSLDTLKKIDSFLNANLQQLRQLLQKYGDET